MRGSWAPFGHCAAASISAEGSIASICSAAANRWSVTSPVPLPNSKIRCGPGQCRPLRMLKNSNGYGGDAGVLELRGIGRPEMSGFGQHLHLPKRLARATQQGTSIHKIPKRRAAFYRKGTHE